MQNRALQIIADALNPVLGPSAAVTSARRIIDALDREADALTLAIDDVVQVAHTSPVCPGCLAHVQMILPNGTVKIRMPAENGNHGYAVLPAEQLIATGGSITPVAVLS